MKDIMKDTLESFKNLIWGVTSVLVSALGLLVVAQAVFGQGTSINVIGNLQGIINGFVGEGASLAGVVTLLLVVALLQKKKEA